MLDFYKRDAIAKINLQISAHKIIVTLNPKKEDPMWNSMMEEIKQKIAEAISKTEIENLTKEILHNEVIQ